MKFKHIYSWLLWLTNNSDVDKREQRKQEIKFDIFFIILVIVCGLFGVSIFLIKHQIEWIPVVIIEMIWAWDNIRHNRVD